MSRIFFLALLFALNLLPASIRAQDAVPANESAQPLVHVDVSVQMDAIERSAQDISHAVDEIAIAMRQVAATGNLSVAQQEHLDGILANLDHVVAVSRQSVDALPEAVARSREAVQTSAGVWLADLKFWFFVIVGVIAVLLVLALAAFYWFTLRPLQRTVLAAVGQISAMAQAMANTSKSLEIINETHREVLRLSGVGDEALTTGAASPEDMETTGSE